MIEKLYAIVAGECEFDNLDAASNHEVLLSGHIYTTLLAEKLYDLLEGAKAKVRKDLKRDKFDYPAMRNPNYLKKLID
jgi:DNA-directed RNA polymerase I subunit RPA2